MVRTFVPGPSGHESRAVPNRWRQQKLGLLLVVALLGLMVLLPASALAAWSTQSVVINSGDIGTNIAPVTLTLAAADGSTTATWMRFSQDAGTTWTNWEAYATSKSLTLATSPVATFGEGTHTVTAEFSTDVAEPSNTPPGHGVNDTTASDTIIYDTTEPATVVTGVDASWHSSDVTVTFTPADPAPAAPNPGPASGLLGIEEYKVDAGAWTPIALVAGAASITIPADPIYHSTDGVHTVSYRAIDNAGNVEHDVIPGTYKSVTVKIDTTVPSASTISGNDALYHSAGSPWSLTFAATDANMPNAAGIAKYQWKVDGGAWADVVANPMTVDPASYSDGTHEFYVRAVDAAVAANTGPMSSVPFRVYTTAPTSTWDNPSVAWWNEPFTMNFSAVDASPTDSAGVDHVESMVAATIGPVTWPATWTAGDSATVPAPANHSRDGVNPVRFRAIDKAYVTSNVETYQTGNVNIDTTPPVTTDDNDGLWHNVPVTVTLTRTDPNSPNHAGVDYTQYRVDGGAWSDIPFPGAATVTIPAPLNHSNDGLRLLQYRSVDLAMPSGNVEDIQSTNVKIDTTAPVTTDNAPATWRSSDVNVTLTPTDVGGSGVLSTLYRLTDNLGAVGGWVAYNSLTGITVTAPGSHTNDGIWTIEYKSTDNVGNVEAVKSTQVKIDTRVPTTSETGLDDGVWHNTPVTVNFTAADQNMPTASGVALTEYRVDGGSWTQGSSVVIPAPAGGANDGKHTVDYRSVDNAVAPNVELIQSGEVWIDTTAPVTTTDHLASFYTAWHNGPVTVNLSATDTNPNVPHTDRSGVDYTTYSVDGGTWVHGTSVSILAPVDGSNDGPHVIQFYSVDNSVDATGNPNTGNVEATNSVTVRIDATAPTTTGVSGWWNPAFPYTLTAIDQIGRSGVAETDYRLDSGSWQTYTAPGITLTGVQGTEHTIDFRSVDNAGNTEVYKTSHVTLDVTPPVTVVNGADSAWHDTPVTLNFSSSDVGAGVDYIEYSLDGGTHWTQGNAVTVSHNGTTTVEYRAVDLAQPSGNVEIANSVDVKVDSGMPVTTISDVPMWNKAPVSFTLSAALGESGIQTIRYQLDGGTAVDVAGDSATLPVSSQGHHTLRARAESNAGVWGDWSTSVEFYIDLTGPTTLAKPASGHHGMPIALAYKVTDNLSPRAKSVKVVVKTLTGKTVKTFSIGTVNVRTWFNVKWTPKKAGTYRYYVYAKDLAGNVQSAYSYASVKVK